jgi:hypothetical protein
MRALTDRMARLMSEEDLLLALTEAATLYGWRWHHIRRSDHALQMGHPGFPDLVLAKDGRVLFWELKAHHAHVDVEQWAWLRALGFTEEWAVPLHVTVIRPSDLDEAIGELAR